MDKLSSIRVAVLATDGFEESELVFPVRALRDAGVKVDILAPHEGEIQGFRHHDKASRVNVDGVIKAANPADYHGLLLPGGALNADQLRVDPDAKKFVANIITDGRPVAAICHAAWILISAGVIQGRRLTAYHTIRDDVTNARAEFEDREVVVDGNLITSRQPSDIPAFNREFIRALEFLGTGKIDEAMSA